MELPANSGQVRMDGWAGESDLSAVARTAYDDDHLYLAFEVTDDQHTAVGGSAMWTGDSVQFAFSPAGAYGPEYAVAIVNGQAQLIRYAAGTATAAPESVQIAGALSGSSYTIELALPWAAISESDSAPDTLPFTFLVNDNDGAGRRGYLEWTPGIGGGKLPQEHGEIEMVPADREWSAWISGPKLANAGETVTYTLHTWNTSNSDVSLDLAAPELGLSQPVLIPASSVTTMDVDVTYPAAGTHTLNANWTDATGTTRGDSRVLTVEVVLPENEITDTLDQVENELPGIAALLSQADQAGIATDYARVQYSVLERFVPYGRDDLAQGRIGRASYVATVLRDTAAEVTADLEAYLDGTKSPLISPRWTTGSIDVDGRSFIGTTTNPADGTTNTGPVFFSGYGHFGQVRTDVPKFTDLGANMIQIEIGPRDVIVPATSTVEEFAVSKSGNVDATVSLDTAVARSGGQSLKIENRSPAAPNVYVTATQNIAVKPNTTYTFDVWVKGTDVRRAWFPGGTGWTQRAQFPTGTYDWTKVSTTHTTGPNEKTYPLRILSEHTGTVWIDDLSVVEDGTTNNLVKNGGFEQSTLPGSNPAWKVSSAKLKSSVVDVLQNAAANDIAVNLLISPHYFPDWAYELWPELRTKFNGLIKFSIDEPIAKELIEDYVHAVVEAVKDEPALHSITISNEPVYQSDLDQNAVQDWRQFLTTKYTDIHGLNAAYGSTFASFADVTMPSTVGSDLRSYDYVTFNNDRFASWHEWLAGVVADAGPGIPVHSKMMANLQGSLSYGVDVERMSQLGSIAGNDNSNYLSGGSASFFKEAAFNDLQQSVTGGPVFNSELHAIPDRDAYYGPEQADQVRSVLWQSAIHGLSAATMWVWERTYDTTSDFEGSVLHRPDAVMAMGDTGLDLNRLATEVTAFQNVAPKVALLWSVGSAVMTPNSLKAMQNAYTAVSSAGLEVGFVTEKQLAEGKLDEFDLVIVPDAGRVAQTTFDAVRDYSQAGGELVVIGTGALQSTPEGQAFDTSERQAIFAAAAAAPAATASIAEIATAVNPTLDALFPERVTVTTANPADALEIEARLVEVNGRTLVNVMNLTGRAVDVELSSSGTPLRFVQELVSGTERQGTSVRIEPRTPSLFEVEPASD